MSFTFNGSSAPLFFRYSELVACAGFLAAVTVTGRVLCVREQKGEYWMYGVEPGGIADWGSTPELAHIAFKRAFHAALIDIAGEAGDPEQFTAAVRQFVTTINEPTATMWEAAVQGVKSSSVHAPELERWPSTTPVGADVEIIREPRPEANRLEDTSQHAVAA